VETLGGLFEEVRATRGPRGRAASLESPLERRG
jgi:hypothetical protein